MEMETIRAMLGWCALINLGILLWWFLFFFAAHDWTYNMHRKWFELSVAQFDAIHYAGMGLFKLATFFFTVVPYLALWIVG